MPTPTILFLVAALLPLSNAFGPLISMSRGLRLSSATPAARCGAVRATLTDEQTEALLEAAKSSKFFVALSKESGASSSTWTSVRTSYPVLDGLDDEALNSAFVDVKRIGAGSRPVEELEDVTAFEALSMPQKVALVRAVKSGTYAEKLEAAAGASAEAWAAAALESPDLVGLGSEKLDAAMASMPSEGAAPVAEGGLFRADNAGSLAVLGALSILYAVYAGGGLGTMGQAETMAMSEDSRLGRAQQMVNTNVNAWTEKNLGPQ